MEYSNELKKMVYNEYSHFIPCIAALESGSFLLGRFLQDSILEVERRDDLSGEELDQYILKSTKKKWKRENIYNQWNKERL